MSVSTRKRNNQGNGNLKTKNNNKLQNNEKSSAKEKIVTSAQTGKILKPQSKEDDGLLWSIAKLVKLLFKGTIALLMFMIMFNFILVVLNTFVLNGKLTKYIPRNLVKDLMKIRKLF